MVCGLGFCLYMNLAVSNSLWAISSNISDRVSYESCSSLVSKASKFYITCLTKIVVLFKLKIPDLIVGMLSLIAYTVLH